MPRMEMKIIPMIIPRKRILRRLEQRWERRVMQLKSPKALVKEGNCSKYLAPFRMITKIKTITNTYSFIVKPSLSKFINVIYLLSQMISTMYFNVMRTTLCHNLYTTIELPDGTGSLLGLWIKLCI